MVMMKMKQQPLATWLKRQQAPKMAQVQDGQMPWQKCSTKRFPRISPPSWPRIKPWRRREREKNKRGKKKRWGWERKRCSISCAVTVRWATCHIVSEYSLKSLLWSLSFMVILIRLIFFTFQTCCIKFFPLLLLLGHQAGWTSAAGVFQCVSLRCFLLWGGESSCFKLDFLIGVVNLRWNSLCWHYKLK